jgi:Putative Ig domain
MPPAGPGCDGGSLRLLSIGNCDGGLPALPDGKLGVAYSYQMSAWCGAAPLVWSLPVPAAFPAGLHLAPSGEISGRTIAQGKFVFSVSVTDGTAAEVSGQYTLNSTE